MATLKWQPCVFGYALAERVLPSSIELRLLEMQRKLSAIAEIPKILSSTLATVSQSFGSLSCEEELYRRKCSYDEDALDYELNEEEEEEEESSEEEQEQEQLQLEHLKSKSVRDGTPESDYASEANYAVNGTHDEQEQEEEEEEGSEQEEEQLETVYYVRLPAACVAADSEDEAGQEELESVMDAEHSNSDSDDFLSTSYTWNLRNVPKLRINDATSVRNLTLSPQLKPETHNAIDISKVRAATPTPQPGPREAQVTSVPAAVASASPTSQKVKQSMRRLIRDAYDIVAFAAALQAG